MKEQANTLTANSESPCLRCGRTASFRGLCHRCYQTAFRLIKAKKTTWEELEKRGKALPKATLQRGPVEGWFLSDK